jgi:formate hydrogenlyase transcriptional activator
MPSSSDILNAKCLIVDDKEVNVRLIEQILRSAGYTHVTSTMDPQAVCALHRDNHFDLILLDLQMPGMDGFEVMEGLKAIETDGYIPVLVITAQPGHKQRALHAGAKDFLSKPFDRVEVLARVHNLLEVRLLYKQVASDNGVLEQTVQARTGELRRANEQLVQDIEERKEAAHSLKNAYAEIEQLKDRFQAESIYLKQDNDREFNFGEIIGRSKALEQVFFKVEQVAPQGTTVLLLGETGTGKGVVARAIHNRSARRDRPLVTVDCTALPANLIESELFGREKGAYTGSDARQMGRFELADHGTMFLDEIGEMPMELQAKLLRVIQDGEFERLGSPRTIKVDVRIIAATNRNLQDEVARGRFRQDLFYRLNVFPITIPPLWQRKEDIPLLVSFFVAKFNKKIGRAFETVEKETMRILQDHHWPGNVRELENVIERAVISSQAGQGGQGGQGASLRVLDRFETSRPTGVEAEPDVKALGEMERDYLIQLLQKTGWRIEGKTGAAMIAGLNPSTLRGRMRKYGIRR